MKYLLSFFIFSFSITTFAQDKNSPLKEILVNSESGHQFIQLMISHLAEYPSENYSNHQILEDIIEINKNLKGYPANTVKSFLLTELYKVIFNFEKSELIDSKNVYISNTNLTFAKAKVKKHSQILSKFSYFLITDMMDNYNPYKENNFINNYLNTSTKKFKDPKKEKRIKLLNKHVGPWIIIFNRMTSQKFNLMTSGYIKNYLKVIKRLSRFFKLQDRNSNSIEVFTTKSGTIEELLVKYQEQKAAANEEQKTDQSPEKDVENIKLLPGEGANPKIEQIIKSLDQKKQ